MLKWPVRRSRKISPVTFVDGVRRSLDTSVDYLRRRQVGWLCDWRSTREVEAVPTTIHIGSDDQDDRDTPGSDKTSGVRHRYLRWCCMGHCRRPLQLEGATTPAGQAWLMMMMMMTNAGWWLQHCSLNCMSIHAEWCISIVWPYNLRTIFETWKLTPYRYT